MGKIKISRWSIYDNLITDRDIAGFIQVCVESNDPEEIADALNIAAKAREINATAKKLRVKRESLYPDPDDVETTAAACESPRKKTPAKRTVPLDALLKTIGELGFRFQILPPDKTSKRALKVAVA